MDDVKARIELHHGRLSSWLCDAAYPLWSTQGVDPAGGFHERLGQDGKPLAEPRRSRVNPRQAYCFAVAPSLLQSRGIRLTAPAKEGDVKIGGETPTPDGKEAATSIDPGLPKVGRNDPCPCGSGKKYKKCHGA